MPFCHQLMPRHWMAPYTVTCQMISCTSLRASWHYRWKIAHIHTSITLTTTSLCLGDRHSRSRSGCTASSFTLVKKLRLSKMIRSKPSKKDPRWSKVWTGRFCMYFQFKLQLLVWVRSRAWSSMVAMSMPLTICRCNKSLISRRRQFWKDSHSSSFLSG